MNKIGLAAFSAILLFACGQDKVNENNQQQQAEKIETNNAIKPPAFNEDSAYKYVGVQVAFGPRVPNSEAHSKTAAYLEKQLKRFGAKTYIQKAEVKSFDNKTLDMQNIIGSYLPDASQRILLMSHWDTRPFADQDTIDTDKPIDGADDGASGVGVLLEIARQLQIKNPTIGVDIVFFDAEDYGQPTGTGRPKPATWCLGSQYWSKNPHRKGYTARFGILLDMVGASNAVFTQEAISRYFAPEVVEKVWNIAAQLGYSNYFPFQQTAHVGDDDHLYVNKIAKIPSIDIIQYDAATGAFAPHWHTHADNMDIINKNTLKAVGQVVLATVYAEK